MSSPHGTSRQIRHYAVVAVLVLLAVAAGVGLVFALRQTSHASKQKAYTSKVTHAVSQMQQLANTIASHYQRSNGKPLTRVTVERPLVGNKLAKSIRVVHVVTGQQEQFSPAETVIFSACGAQNDCSVGGTDTPSRRVLAERQALELALKTFESDPAANFVLVKLPLSLGGAGRLAAYFERSQLARPLEQPYSQTLSPTTPPPDGVMDTAEQKTIDRLVQNIAFVSSTTQTVKMGAIVVVPAGEALAVGQQQAQGAGGGTAP